MYEQSQLRNTFPEASVMTNGWCKWYCTTTYGVYGRRAILSFVHKSQGGVVEVAVAVSHVDEAKSSDVW